MRAGIVFGFLGNSESSNAIEIPNKSDALFWLDGTISGNQFIDKSGNGRHFTITNKDFDATWTKGLPYKSYSTISAPVGDTALIAADVNHFLYTAGTPNELPATAFFQDIEYANKLFCRNAERIVDPNNAEIYEPRVLDIVLYSSARTGADLTTCQTYYNVPAEITTNVRWIDPVNGNDANVGSKAAPCKTYYIKVEGQLSNGWTVYFKNGNINEEIYITKSVAYIGTGFSKNYNSPAFRVTATGGETPTIKGMDIINAGYGVLFANNALVNINLIKNRISASSSGAIYKNTHTVGTVLNLTQNIILSQINIDTSICNGNIFKSTSSAAVSCRGDFDSAYDKFTLAATSPICAFGTATSVISIFNSYINGYFSINTPAQAISFSLDRCYMTTTAPSGLFGNIAIDGDVSITNCTIIQTNFYDSESSYAFRLNCNNIEFNNNVVTNQNAYIVWGTTPAANKTFNFNNNICKTLYCQIVKSDDYVFVAHNNILVSESTSTFRASSINNTSVPATICNNTIVVKNQGAGIVGGGGFVALGTEYDSIQDGRLNGSKVYNNRFSGPADYGNSRGTLHGPFAWNQEVEWCYNYLSGSNLGFVVKSIGSTYVNKIHHNLIGNVSSCFTIKGVKGTLIYNNTIVDGGAFDTLKEPFSAGGDGYAGNTILKNNVFTSILDLAFIAVEYIENWGGCVTNYNNFYNPNYDQIGIILPDGYKTLAQWKAMGYDTNSDNANPQLTSFIPAAGSSIIGAGVNLGADYQTGLDVATTWGDENATPVVITKQQPANWNKGAYIL